MEKLEKDPDGIKILLNSISIIKKFKHDNIIRFI